MVQRKGMHISVKKTFRGHKALCTRAMAVVASSAFFLSSCFLESSQRETMAIDVRSGSVLVYRASVEPEPNNRSFVAIGELSQQGREALAKYVRTSRKELSYFVACPYYLEIRDLAGNVRVLGICTDDPKGIIALDASQPDPRKVHTTGGHEMYVGDANTGAIILENVRSLDSTSKGPAQ